MIMKFYHYSDFVTVEFTKYSKHADEEKGNRKVKYTELCKVDNEGLTFSSKYFLCYFKYTYYYESQERILH